VRDRRRITEAALLASVLSGAPSTLHSLFTTRSVKSAARGTLDATRAVGTLLPPGRPALVKGAVAHLGISFAMAELLARTLPEKHPIVWGAAAGLTMGLLNVAVIGRSFPSIRALPIGPQLTDNVAFGVVFATAVDARPQRGDDGCWQASVRGMASALSPSRTAP